MEIDLKGDDINKLVANAILESKLGEAIQASVKRVMADVEKTYNSPIDQVIKNHVSETARAIIVKEYTPMIEAKVKDFISKTITEKMIESAANKVASGMLDRFT